MTVLRSTHDPNSPAARQQRRALEEKLDELGQEHAKALAGGGPKYTERHHSRGKLLPRERIELLIDRDSAFLELSPLAAWGSDYAVGASVVTGIGVVEGVECVLVANDPTVKGGASNPWTMKKIFRASDIARENRLPLINLVESGGADLPSQAEIFIPGGRAFKDLTNLSALGIPTIALVFGNSTAGGAYIPGMCDHVVMVRKRAKVFLGGPPLVKMATGEVADEESLGGAEMHARTSGLADHLAEDELDAIRLGRRIVANLNWRKHGQQPGPAEEPRYDPGELLGIAQTDLRQPLDPREVLARVVDGSRFDEFKPLYGTSLVTGWASVHGYPVGVLANARGVLFSEEAQKATQFIQLANRADTPLVFLQNTTGYMVGTEYEQRGIIKHGAQMINAVSNSRVPHVTIVMGASYGAGNYGMCGRAYEPRFLFTWPNAKSAVMGPAQLAGVISIVARQAAEARGQAYDEAGDAMLRAAIEQQVEAQSLAAFLSGRLYDDGIIDPRDTRTVLGLCLSAIHSGPVSGATGYGVFPSMIKRLLIANRGEISQRIIRTCRTAGVSTVALFSDADAEAPHARAADLAVHLPGNAPADTYLRSDLIIAAALKSGADAIHPGYGFLSENADFARAVLDAGLTWIGPPPEAIEAMGSKVTAKKLMADAGVPVLGAGEDRFPLLVKAAAGGGGRGMRIVRHPAELEAALASARREAESAFGDPTVFTEPYIETGRHIEVQLLADRHGTIWTLGERECSIQRRHQKVIEETPSPFVGPELRDALFDASVRAATAIGYVGAGTVEFLVEPSGEFWFLEVNTRLQVEHPVTEAVYGLDLVALQLAIAEGAALGEMPEPQGHAIEVRLYAEDPAQGWRPQSGALHRFDVPGEVRIDSGVEDGSTISTHYDPMLAKVIAHAPTRTQAARKLASSLRRARIHGPVTNRDLLVRVLEHDEFLAGAIDTGFLDRHDLTAPLVSNVDLSALAAALAGAATRRAAATVQRAIPAGWRNNPSEPQRATYRVGSRELTVPYETGHLHFGSTNRADEPAIRVTVREASADEVALDDANGVVHRFAVHQVGDVSYVDGPEGSVTLTEVPRFPEPGSAVAPGSLLAPMPGTVVRVHVEPGATVAKGDLLLTLEAMKMEHPIAAPHDGTVAELTVTTGSQVDAGAVLAVITAMEEQ